MDTQRASREEIFQRLRALLGDTAVEIVETVTRQYNAGDVQEALQTLNEYDSRLGGFGIYRSDGKKLPGVYRAFSYVEMPLRNGTAHEYGRLMIHSSCAHLEELIKRLKYRWPGIADNMPLGKLVKEIHNRLPPNLAEHLKWLNGRLCVFAKHNYNMARAGMPEGPEPEHYFEMDEAIAIYFIVRALGGQLEEWSQKPARVFLKE